MPPKAMFKKEEIVEAALGVVREKGLDALTARELGSQLGSSARPIFTVFKNMEEVQTEVFAAAENLFYEYTGDYAKYTPAFKRWGMQVYAFAKNEPKLYQILFMREGVDTPLYKDDGLEEYKVTPLTLLQSEYELSTEQASDVLSHLWVYLYGMCTMCARGVCEFSDEEVSHMLGSIFGGQMMLIKSGKEKFTDVMPQEGEHIAVMGDDVRNVPF